MSSTRITNFTTGYQPYGNLYQPTGKSEFTFTGKFAATTGLMYFGARWYDTSIGRFITQDSFVGSIVDPMSLNRYIYARDNPMRMVDPTGHYYVISTGGVTNTESVCEADPAACHAASSTLTGGMSVKSGDLTLTEGGNYQYSYPAPPSGPPDVRLTVNGVNQYTNSPTVGIESWTSTSPFANSCGVRPCQPVSGTQAQAITVATVLGAGSLLVGIVTSPGLVIPWVNVGVAILDTSLFDANQNADQYLIDSGSSATPGGVLGAYGQGLESGPLDYVWNAISDWFGSL